MPLDVALEISHRASHEGSERQKLATIRSLYLRRCEETVVACTVAEQMFLADLSMILDPMPLELE